MTMSDKIVDIADYGGAAPLPVLTLAELRAQSHNVRWMVKHMVPADSLGVLFGGSGTFKSFIAIDMALHIAHGLPWLGRKTKQGSVVILAAEGGAGIWRRIVAWHRAHRINWVDAPVHVIPVSVDLTTEAARVHQAISMVGVVPELIVVDTMSQTFSGEENSAAEVGSYLREVGLWLRTAWSAAVLLVHHTGHAATERPRGSSALHSGVDFMFGCYRDEKEMLATLESVKQKDGELAKPTSFSMKVVDIAIDEDGEPITSLAATALIGDQVVGAMNYEAERGRGGRNHLFLDLALNGIEEKKLRALFVETIDGDAEVKRRAYYRARNWARDAGLIEIASGVVIRLRDDLDPAPPNDGDEDR